MLVGIAVSFGCSTDDPLAPTSTCPEESDGLQDGEASGALCPPGSAVTYDGFVKPFMQQYCTRCHDSQLTGSDRQCAPLAHDCDTAEGILKIGEHIDEAAAAGPDVVNTSMPPSGPRPTADERRQLGEWLACNADAWGTE